jgi:hypothetical protein
MLRIFNKHAGSVYATLRSAVVVDSLCTQQLSAVTRTQGQTEVWRNTSGNCVCVCDDVDWIHMAQDRDQWWAIVNKKRTFGFHKKKRGISWQAVPLWLVVERLSLLLCTAPYPLTFTFWLSGSWVSWVRITAAVGESNRISDTFCYNTFLVQNIAFRKRKTEYRHLSLSSKSPCLSF